MAGTTTLPALTDTQFAARMAALFPCGWASQDAMSSGAVHALFKAFGGQLSSLLTALDYARGSILLGTATAPELDLASEDFLGDALLRPAGMPDAKFAALIIARLFRSAATRTVLSNALLEATGVTPRMLEPWQPADTGVWNSGASPLSFWNVDTALNPARWAPTGLRYQGFIETAPPQSSTGGQPVLGWSDGAFWNVPGYGFMIIEPPYTENLYALVDGLRAFGTTAWLRITSLTNVISQPSGPTAPSAPSGVAVSAVSQSSITIVTNPSSGTLPITYQALYRQSGTSGPFLSGPTVAPAADVQPSLTITNLAPGTSYDVEVTASNSVGTAQPSPIITQQTQNPNAIAPSAPIALQATSIGSNSITITCAISAGTAPIAYQGYYQVSGAAQFIVGPSETPVGTAIPTLNFTGLTPLTNYAFQITASNQGGVSAPSAILFASTVAVPVAPSVPANVAASAVTTNSVTITANASTGTTPITYQVFYQASGASGFTAGPTGVNPSLTVTGLTSGSSYNFYMTATNSVGTSAASATVSATTFVLPSVPTGFAIQAFTDTTITATASASTGTQPITYTLWARPTGTTPWVFSQAETPASGGAPAITVTGLTAATEYDVAMTASNGGGTSAFSGVLTQTTAAAQSAPSVPTGLSATAETATSVTITASASTGTTPITYQGYFRVTGTTPFTPGPSVTPPSGGPTLVFSGLTAATSYDFTITATNLAGTSQQATPVTQATSATTTAPSVPTGLSVTAFTTTSVTLSASASTGTEPITYNSFYQLVAAGSSQVTGPTVTPASGVGPTVTITGLASNTKYAFWFTATNVAGTSAVSATVEQTTASATVAPSVPTNLSVSNITQTSVVLTASASTGTEPITYNSFYVIAAAGGTTVAGPTVTPASGVGPTVTITGLQANTKYGFSFSATNVAGTSAGSASVTATTAQPVATRNWYQNPGEDGHYWVTPFYTSAQFDTTSAAAKFLRSAAGQVDIPPNYSWPFYTGTANDPTVTITDGNFTLTGIHVPAGAIPEGPANTDNNMGGVDVTRPYLFWSGQNVTVDGSTTGAVKQGSTIHVGTSFVVGDASGPIMEDATVGTVSQNALGGIQEYELLQALADPNYVIQHMLQFESNSLTGTHVWPLSANDPNSGGLLTEGQVIGIPANVAMPGGLTRGGQLLWTNLQQQGWILYNYAGVPGPVISVYPLSSQTQALANDIANSISSVLPYVGILTPNQTPTAIKGFVPGATPAFPPPPPLDLSPTGGVNVAPSTFTGYAGGWYGSNPPYNVIPSNTGTTGTSRPGQVTGLASTAQTSSSVTLSWSAPGSGGTPTSYTMQFALHGQTLANGASVTGTTGTVSGLQPNTSYDFAVFATNAAGNGQASSTITVSTSAASGAVTTWNTSGSSSTITFSNSNETATSGTPAAPGTSETAVSTTSRS